MKKLFILAVVLAMFVPAFGQSWQVNIIVRGDLPDDTNISQLQAAIENAIEANADSASYVFDFRVISNGDLVYRSKIDIHGTVKPSKELETFKNSIVTYFNNIFDDAEIAVRYFWKEEI